MKVIARTNRGQGLPESEQLEFGASVSTVHSVSRGQEYGVFGMLFAGPFLDLESFGLQFLILRDHGLPGAVPAALFEVSDPTLPSDWLFRRLAPQTHTRVRAMWGYQAMINDLGHLDSLFEIEKPAQRIFLSEMDRGCLAGRDEEHVSALERKQKAALEDIGTGGLRPRCRRDG